jgi:hypothetical protein
MLSLSSRLKAQVGLDYLPKPPKPPFDATIWSPDDPVGGFARPHPIDSPDILCYIVIVSVIVHANGGDVPALRILSARATSQPGVSILQGLSGYAQSVEVTLPWSFQVYRML